MGTMASEITSLTIVYSTVYSSVDQAKYQSFMSLAFVQGIHQWPVNSPHRGPVTRKMFSFDDVIMWHWHILGSRVVTYINIWLYLILMHLTGILIHHQTENEHYHMWSSLKWLFITILLVMAEINDYGCMQHGLTVALQEHMVSWVFVNIGSDCHMLNDVIKP